MLDGFAEDGDFRKIAVECGNEGCGSIDGEDVEVFFDENRSERVSMEEEVYRRKGVASLVTIHGDIEGRIIFDIDSPTAARVAAYLAGSPQPEDDEVARETVCELANMVIGSAITALNDQGFQFKINPPVAHTDQVGEKSSEDQEALVMCFGTATGNVFMNIAMRYNARRKADRRN